MRERLLDRVAFLAAFLIAVTLATAVIVVVVAGHHDGRLVVRPAATASPAHDGKLVAGEGQDSEDGPDHGG